MELVDHLTYLYCIYFSFQFIPTDLLYSFTTHSHNIIYFCRYGNCMLVNLSNSGDKHSLWCSRQAQFKRSLRLGDGLFGLNNGVCALHGSFRSTVFLSNWVRVYCSSLVSYLRWITDQFIHFYKHRSIWNKNMENTHTFLCKQNTLAHTLRSHYILLWLLLAVGLKRILIVHFHPIFCSVNWAKQTKYAWRYDKESRTCGQDKIIGVFLAFICTFICMCVSNESNGAWSPLFRRKVNHGVDIIWIWTKHRLCWVCPWFCYLVDFSSRLRMIKWQRVRQFSFTEQSKKCGCGGGKGKTCIIHVVWIIMLKWRAKKLLRYRTEKDAKFRLGWFYAVN